MAIKMRIETPIAFGLTLTVCLVLFFYCWRIRKIRNRLTRSVQVSALPIAETVPVSSTFRLHLQGDYALEYMNI